MKEQILDNLFKKTTNYENMSKDATVTIDIKKHEMALILEAFDYGLNSMDSVQLEQLDHVINKLKFELWP